MTKLSEEFKIMFAVLSNKLNALSSSPTQKDTSTPPEPTTVVPDNRRSPPLEEGNYIKVGGMWTLKHEISSPKFYEILIKTELRGDTDLNLKKFYTTSRCASMR